MYAGCMWWAKNGLSLWPGEKCRKLVWLVVHRSGLKVGTHSISLPFTCHLSSPDDDYRHISRLKSPRARFETKRRWKGREQGTRNMETVPFLDRIHRCFGRCSCSCLPFSRRVKKHVKDGCRSVEGTSTARCPAFCACGRFVPYFFGSAFFSFSVTFFFFFFYYNSRFHLLLFFFVSRVNQTKLVYGRPWSFPPIVWTVELCKKRVAEGGWNLSHRFSWRSPRRSHPSSAAYTHKTIVAAIERKLRTDWRPFESYIFTWPMIAVRRKNPLSAWTIANYP